MKEEIQTIYRKCYTERLIIVFYGAILNIIGARSGNARAFL